LEKTDWLKFILATPEDWGQFGDRAEQFQIDDYEGMIRRLFCCIIRQRGADKTSGLARFVRAVLFLSERKENIIAVAADVEQGGNFVFRY